MASQYGLEASNGPILILTDTKLKILPEKYIFLLAF
jgi:hypothetical protein